MVRNRGKKAFYEVIGKTWPKSSQDKTVEPLHPEKPDKDKLDSAKSGLSITERAFPWLKRPKMVHLNAGRIDLSIPYQLAIAIFLAFVLLILVVFRLGQISERSDHELADLSLKIAKSQQKTVEPSATGTLQGPYATEKVPQQPAGVESAVSEGNNRIVIQTYQNRADLVPVKNYFAQFGIVTEIRKIGDWYYLVTKDKYENPERPQTDGYLAKQRIIQLGAKYKAPQGYETFGKRPFYDSYGQRFDD